MPSISRSRASSNGSISPDTDPWSIGVACCDVVNRGWAYADGKLIYNLLDDRTIALDANTGKVVWQTKMGDVNTGETMTMAPLVVRDKVIVGNSGGEMGVHGWVAALDLKTGQASSGAPTARVPIASSRSARASKRSTPKTAGRIWESRAGLPTDGATARAACGGGSPTIPDLNLIYYGTSNPGPWTQNQRPGDNKWTSTTLRPRPRQRRGALGGSVDAAR